MPADGRPVAGAARLGTWVTVVLRGTPEVPFARASVERTIEFAGDRTAVGLAVGRMVDAMLEPAFVRAGMLG